MLNLTKKSKYEIDLAKAANLWYRNADITKSVEDLFSTRLSVPDRGDLVLPTHYNPRHDITAICYDDALKEAQEDIGRYFNLGEVFIGVKHHKPEHPTLESAGKEAVKFDATHISVGVVVEATGKNGITCNGAVTINNPRDYAQEYGLFGDPTYPMIFLRLKFPPEINATRQSE